MCLLLCCRCCCCCLTAVGSGFDTQVVASGHNHQTQHNNHQPILHQPIRFTHPRLNNKITILNNIRDERETEREVLFITLRLVLCCCCCCSSCCQMRSRRAGGRAGNDVKCFIGALQAAVVWCPRRRSTPTRFKSPLLKDNPNEWKILAIIPKNLNYESACYLTY